MRRLRRLGGLPAACAAALLGCAAAQNAAEGTGKMVEEGYQQVSEATTDSSINFAVKAALVEDDTIHSRDITVSTDKGVVTLTGSQPTPEAVQRAGEIARGAKGVRDVKNELIVKPAAAP